MAHTHYRTNENPAADAAGTVALVILLLGVLIVGIIAYRNLWPSAVPTTPTQNNTNITVPTPTINPGGGTNNLGTGTNVTPNQ